MTQELRAKITVWLAIAVAAVLAVVLATSVVNATNDKPPKEEKDKVNICHATSSESNPYEAIQVDKDGLNGHDDHEKDFAYNGPLDDKGKPTKDGDEWCENNVPEPPKEEEPPVVVDETPKDSTVNLTPAQQAPQETQSGEAQK